MHMASDGDDMPCKIVLTMAAISLYNWNYDAPRLLSKVESLMNRDKNLFGSVVQRSATQTLATGETEHVITLIEILPPSEARTATMDISGSFRRHTS